MASGRELSPRLRRELHSPKLTWKSIQFPFRRTLVFVGLFFDFHVSFRECSPLCFFAGGVGNRPKPFVILKPREIPYELGCL